MHWEKKTWGKYILFLLVSLCVIVLLGVGMQWVADRSKPIVESTETMPEDNYMDIVIFGLDNHVGGELSHGRADVILIVSINENTKEVKLASVFRDMMVETKDRTFVKINSVYESGGVDEEIATINMNLDMKIENYVSVDWGGVAKVIDNLGGIEIKLEPDEVAALNECIPEIDELTGTKTEWIAESGNVHLNGTQATAYARIRAIDDDVMRTSRQRIVLEKVSEKAKQAEMSQLIKICKDIFGMVKTNMSIVEVLNMVSDVKKYQIVETRGFPSYMAPCVIDEENYVVPIELKDNVIEMHRWLYKEDDYVINEIVEGISNDIVDKTGYTSDESTLYIYDGMKDSTGVDGTGDLQ